MKKRVKFFVSFYVILALIACQTQKELKLNQEISCKFSKQFQQVSKADILQQISDFSDNAIVDFSDKLYIIDSVIVGIYYKPNFIVFARDKPFSYYKSLYTYALKLSNYQVNDISLQNYHGEQYIIEDYTYKNDHIFHFKYFKSEYNTNIGGYIRYGRSTSKTAAKKILDEILNNVEVKRN